MFTSGLIIYAANATFIWFYYVTFNNQSCWIIVIIHTFIWTNYKGFPSLELRYNLCNTEYYVYDNVFMNAQLRPNQCVQLQFLVSLQYNWEKRSSFYNWLFDWILLITVIYMQISHIVTNLFTVPINRLLYILFVLFCLELSNCKSPG